ncbi:MAG: SLC13 family permease [Planctomycetota bacterium]|jgi:sodium-dependent dicarboxylate transporter 2/3/5
MPSAKSLTLALGPVLAILMYLVLRHVAELPQPACFCAAITTLTACWWVFEPIPIPATSLIPFALFPVFGVLDRATVAGAYGHRLILLLLGGFILSTAMEKSGAHRRLALTMVHVVGGSSGKRIVLGFMIASSVLSMWISNMATTLMLLPVALAVMEQVGATDRKRLGVPLLLGVAYAANVGGIGTPIGTPPNLIFIEHFQQKTGVEWSFGQWMTIGVPVTAAMVPLIWIWITRGLRLDQPLTPPHPGQWSAEEKRVMAVFATTAFLWITRSGPDLSSLVGAEEKVSGWNGLIEHALAWDGPTLVGDSTVALFMIVVMFLVPNGRGEGLLDWKTASSIPWGLFILFGGGIAIGMAFGASGLSAAIGEALEAVTAWPVIFMIAGIALTVTFLTEVTSNTATTNLMMPILAATAGAVGAADSIPPELLMVPAALSASCAFMLPVATPPNAIVFGAGYITPKRMIREGFALNLIGVVVITTICWVLLG